MFADDIAFVAHSDEDMQEIVTHFAGAAKAFLLQVNIKKWRWCTSHPQVLMVTTDEYKSQVKT